MESRNRMNQKQNNRKTARKLVLLAVGMFGFGFAMWPLYNVLCDLTGLGGKGVQIANDASAVEKSERRVKIRFDATVNSTLPWIFQAKEKVATVQLGVLTSALYLAMNPTDEDLAGQAVYNVTPPEASLYFVKTECFCFTRQLLRANESREMPVYYYVRPDLPEHIKELTLSYTFYRNDDTEMMAMSAPTGDNQE
jgi:cytochrome c oxidase assembly protein subunit 11